MKRLTMTLLIIGFAFASPNPPSEWVKGFWIGYEAGKLQVLKALKHMKEVLEIKRQILQGLLPPCYIDENGKVKFFEGKNLKPPYQTLQNGWYAVVDTSQLTTPQKWWIIYKIRQMGFNAYDKGSIYIGAFLNNNDARTLKNKIEKMFGVDTYIVEVNQ